MSAKKLSICDDDIERFEAFFVKDNGCWEWNGYLDRHGYGTFKLLRNTILAHRMAWIFYKGRIPSGAQILHTCDNRSCVNPEHLLVGDHKLNMRHMRERNRAAKGEKQPKTTLTESQVIEIREKYATSLYTQVFLASEYSVCPATISNIVNRSFWTHI